MSLWLSASLSILKASGQSCLLHSLLGPRGCCGKERPFKESPGVLNLFCNRPLSGNVCMPSILDIVSEGSQTSHGWFPHSLWTPSEEALPRRDPSVLQSGTQDLRGPRPKSSSGGEEARSQVSVYFIHSLIHQILTVHPKRQAPSQVLEPALSHTGNTPRLQSSRFKGPAQGPFHHTH